MSSQRPTSAPSFTFPGDPAPQSRLDSARVVAAARGVIADRLSGMRRRAGQAPDSPADEALACPSCRSTFDYGSFCPSCEVVLVGESAVEAAGQDPPPHILRQGPRKVLWRFTALDLAILALLTTDLVLHFAW